MYKVVNRAAPFEGDTTVTVALAHLEEPITRPSVYNLQIPVRLENNIFKNVQRRSREHRYRSVEEVIADLRRVLGSIQRIYHVPGAGYGRRDGDHQQG